MSKQLNELKKRQADRLQSRPAADPYELVRKVFGINNKVESHFPRNSLGYFADELHLPPPLLIEQFSEAGLRGLSENSTIRDKDKSVLLTYLRRSQSLGSSTAPLYEHREISSADISLVSEVSDRLISYLAKNPEAMYSLAPRKFEEMVASLLERQGCEVTLTKGTRDGGYDIWAQMRTPISKILILAECKRYDRTNKVGVEVVRGLYGVTEMHRANQGIIVTSSFFTKDAHKEQLRIGDRISLTDFDHLSKWLADCSSSA